MFNNDIGSISVLFIVCSYSTFSIASDGSQVSGLLTWVNLLRLALHH